MQIFARLYAQWKKKLGRSDLRTSLHAEKEGTGGGRAALHAAKEEGNRGVRATLHVAEEGHRKSLRASARQKKELGRAALRAVEEEIGCSLCDSARSGGRN